MNLNEIEASVSYSLQTSLREDITIFISGLTSNPLITMPDSLCRRIVREPVSRSTNLINNQVNESIIR